MKVSPSVKRICENCRVIRRHGRVMVICVETSMRTSAVRSRSTATKASVTVRDFLCAVSAPRPMLVPARARSARSPERRRPPSSRWHDSGHEMIFIPSPERQQQSSLLGNEGQWQRLSKPLVSPVVATASRSRSARLTSSPLSTTRSFRSPIRPAPWCPGRPVAMSASRAPVSPRRSPRRWPPRPPRVARWSTHAQGRRLRQGPRLRS